MAELEESIRTILLNEWDPVAIHDIPEAADEYDDYVADIAAMLKASVSKEALAAHLLELEEGIMVRDGDAERARRVAEKLLSLV